MSNTDKSNTERLARLRQRTQAIFYVRNPDIRKDNTIPESVRQSRALGQIRITLEGPEGTLTTVEPCCPIQAICEPVCPVSTDDSNTPVCVPIDLVDVDSDIGFNTVQEEIVNAIYGTPTTMPPPPEGYAFNIGLCLVTPIYCNATQITVRVLDESGNEIPSSSITNLGLVPPSNDQGLGYVFIIYPGPSADIFQSRISVTVSNECSSSSGEAQFECFLAGSPVTLADGTTKPIETVAVGDRVIGAFGEINTVTGTLSGKLGFASITNINGEHKATAPHPHIRADHKFCCTDTLSLTKFAYGRSFPLKGADGKTEARVIKGVNPERITTLQVGTVLQTLTGPRTVTTLETIRMPASTRVYHLTTDGSHSYMVDGYAVAGGATEEDFDYDTWTVRTA
jgi:hypothetical protein